MLHGRSIIITGAAGALGQKAIAAVEDAGGVPVLFNRSFPDDFPGDHARYEIDLTDAAAVEAVVARVGGFHGVLNIAGGFSMGTPVYEDDADDWAKMQALNVATVRNMMKAAIPLLVKQGRGSVVNVGAYAARQGAANMGAYASAKAAVMSLTQTAAEEVKGAGVNVNAVLPTIIDSPANRAAMPDADPASWVDPYRLAQVMVFLTTDAAKDVHGALIPVRGLS